MGIENPTPSVNAIHDQTEQEKFFSYVSTVLPNNARWTMITGAAVGNYQIPNNPGQPVRYFTPTVTDFNAANLNEYQFEQNYYGVLAFQQSTAFTDYQVSYFSRFSTYITRPTDRRSHVQRDCHRRTRISFLNGVQADAAFRVPPDHTVRAGVVVSAEQTPVSDNASVFCPAHADRPSTRFRPAPTLQAGSQRPSRWSMRIKSSAGLRGSIFRMRGKLPVS